MSSTITVQMGRRGVVTLPKRLRESFNLEAGDRFPLLDLGGVFVLSPHRSDVDALADRITQALTERGETLETRLQVLREERASYAGRR